MLLVKARKTVYPPVSCSTVFRVVFLHLSFLSLHNRFSRISLSKTCAIKDHRILSKRCFSFSVSNGISNDNRVTPSMSYVYDERLSNFGLTFLSAFPIICHSFLLTASCQAHYHVLCDLTVCPPCAAGIVLTVVPQASSDYKKPGFPGQALPQET